MSETTITELPDPLGYSSDPFTDVLRDGARKLIEQAIHAELATLMAAFSETKLEDGRARVVRHGHLPEREVMTGIGPVPVKVPRVRDREPGDDRITFTPSILPRYLRKAKSVEELLPWLYLKGVSTGDFTEALEALLGPNAKGLSPKTITRLKADWWQDYDAWQKRDLGARRFLYIWADGVYFKPRMAEEKQCVLVVVGADEYGRKELLAMTDGVRESTQSWREVLLDLKRRGLKQDPKLATGDGALGFWTALREVCLSRRTGLAMAFRLMMSAQKKWRNLDGQNRLPEIIKGVEFRDGLRHVRAGVTNFCAYLSWFLVLPLYSPDLNSIEMALSKLKAHRRRIGVRTFTDMFTQSPRFATSTRQTSAGTTSRLSDMSRVKGGML